MIQTLLAQIKNPALAPHVQNASSPQSAANILGIYIAVLWRTVLILGGLAVIIFLLMGGLLWITAGGDKGKIEQAKERIIQAIIGFAVLASVAAVSIFLSQAFGINLLRPDFGVLRSSSSSGGGNGGGGGSGSDCSGGLNLGQTGSDGGSGGYCTDGGAAMMKCVGAGEGPSGFNYSHLEPCSCLEGEKKAGYTFTAC